MPIIELYSTLSIFSELSWNASTNVRLSTDFHLVVDLLYDFLSFSSVKLKILARNEISHP